MRKAKQRHEQTIDSPRWRYLHRNSCRAVHAVKDEHIGKVIGQTWGHHECKIEGGGDESVEIRCCSKRTRCDLTGRHVRTQAIGPQTMMRAEARSGGSGSRLRSSGVTGQHGDDLKGRGHCRGSMRLGRQRTDHSEVGHNCERGDDKRTLLGQKHNC